MEEKLVVEFVALCIYTFFMGFVFCDFYKLHIGRKLTWFIPFLLISIFVLKAKGEFDLGLILPLPTLWAIGLGWWQKKNKQQWKEKT